MNSYNIILNQFLIFIPFLIIIIKFQMPKSKQAKQGKADKKAPKAKTSINQIIQNQQNCVGKIAQDLNNIIQVTEEHQTNRFNTETIQEVSAFIKKKQKTLWQRSFQCVKNIFPCFKQKSQFSINVKEQQLLKTIQKLRNQKIKTKPFLPPLSKDKKTLVLDIDQTLVFSSQNQLERYDFTFTIPYKKNEIRVYTKNRFGLESFLFQMSKIYEIVIYTTNIKEYADNVLKNIDKKKRISYVLYKQKCLNLNKIHYLKSLKAIGRDPETTIFIDHNIASGILQPKNFLQIRPFVGERHDRQLIKLIPFLRQLASKQSVVPVNKIFEQYCNREIRLKYNSIDQSKNDQQDKENEFEERKKYYEQSLNSRKKKFTHRKLNSQIESLTKNQRENESNKQKQDIETQESQFALQNRDLNLQEAV